MLGVAAGDTAGGAWELGYSAITEQATVIAYQLIEHGSLDRERLIRGLRELDGNPDGDPVYRAESAHFRAWLDRAAAASPVPGEEPSVDGIARSVPLGVAFRRDPVSVITESAALGKLFHADAGSVMAGVVTAAAVAASCFAQSGHDLVAAVGDSVLPAVDDVSLGATGVDRLLTVPHQFSAALGGVGVVAGDEALDAVGGEADDPLSLAIAGVLLAAPVPERYHTAVEQAARLGGSALAAAVGAMVGARVGIRAWPWAFANDTWFAEIGRRVVRGPDEVRDLPIPYAVEQHLMSGSGHGFH